MSKDMYIAALEELVDEEMERTGCDWSVAYDRMADGAWDRMRDRLADMADDYRQRRKEGLA